MALKDSTVKHLQKVDQEYRAAWQAREDAVCKAWQDNPGASLRAIADAVGLTHTGVSDILARRAGVDKDDRPLAVALPAASQPAG